MNSKLYMEADIDVKSETEELRKEAASVISLPEDKEKQPDLLYFTGLFVSSGDNLNKAHFLPSELTTAGKTVPSKAVDIEHEEEEVIGHIYDYAFIDKKGNKLEPRELSSMGKADLDNSEMHILIAGIIYKSRFPEIASEVADNKWKISMECFYKDFDIKVGDLIMGRNEAELLGLETSNNSTFGSPVKVMKRGVELASGEASRVLRGILFSGVGIVKNPANPPSVIFDTASKDDDSTNNVDTSTTSGDHIILDYDKIVKAVSNQISTTSGSYNMDQVDTNNPSYEEEVVTQDGAAVVSGTTHNHESSYYHDNNVCSATVSGEQSNLTYDDSLGICVNYKKRVYEGTFQDQDTEVLKEDWCTAYNQSCTSFSRDTSDPDCLRNVYKAATAYIEDVIEEKETIDKHNKLLEDLLNKVNRAKKLK